MYKTHKNIVYMMLQYPELVTNLIFCKIFTIPLELRVGIKVNFNIHTNDGTYTVVALDFFSKRKNLI